MALTKFAPGDPVDPIHSLLNRPLDELDTEIARLDNLIDTMQLVLNQAAADSGWINITPTSPYTYYGGGGSGRFEVRKIGNFVRLRGTLGISNSNNISNNVMGMLPIGFQPSEYETSIQQGSGTANWQLNITTARQIRADRYSLSGQSNVWLPFSMGWFTG